MEIIADFHIHSRFSRATSKELNIENIAKWGKLKGVDLIATGDFTHPKWLSELKENLEPENYGIFKLKNGGNKEVRFILVTEISSIYSKNNRTYRIHNLIFAPSFEIVDKINNKLGAIGNLTSDGRPILGLDAKELLKIVLDASDEAMVVPAHIWTPWFSLYGANSGFNSIEECFEELSPYIYTIETGLSSDPAMNWRIKELDCRGIISGSDSHSLKKIGREACVLNTDLDYKSITSAIKGREPDKLLYTIEFFPEEGKYHYTGHRKCNIIHSPNKTKEKGNICPICKRKLTVGVMHRVEELANPNRSLNYIPKNSPKFKKLIPLEEIIAGSLGKNVGTKAVENEYFNLINNFGSELKVLLDTPISDIEKINPKLASGIERVREEKVDISPGYDGEYGKVKIFKEVEDLPTNNQISLF